MTQLFVWKQFLTILSKQPRLTFFKKNFTHNLQYSIKIALGMNYRSINIKLE